MWLVVGLGNPGDKYAYTWHNCGFLGVEMLADRNHISIDKAKFQGIYGKGKIAGKDAIIVKPTTYMNLSGQCVVQIANYFKIDPSHIIVLYDDIDIKIGTIRVRTKGSAGTHNGMKSIINCLSSQDFPRVRIGTGPVPENWALVDYVLSDIAKDIRPQVFDSFKLACEAVEKMIGEND